MDIELLRCRAAIIQAVRNFFIENHYLELDTPLLSSNLIPETAIEVFKTERLLPAASGVNKSEELYLIPSPEIFIKKLLAKHKTNMFEICKCFRNGEQTGFMHNFEFTMLEYYTVDADYIDSITITEKLFEMLLQKFECENKTLLAPPFFRLTMNEAFEKFAHFSLYDAIYDTFDTVCAGSSANILYTEAKKLGLDVPPDTSDAALYDLIFIHAVEPALPKDRPVCLIDYPAIVPTLAQNNRDGKTKQRWELYANGIELANCYSEENDAESVKKYFAEETAAKEKSAIVKHRTDNEYWRNFKTFPHCSGVAIGLDRLVMLLCAKSTIDSVLPFPEV